MALKDLVSDLSNFNGRSQYDKLDTQIKEGVDFIPNTDAPGFTPKTDLESLYIKANSAVSAKPPGFVPASDGQFSQTWGSNFPTQFKNGFFPIADAVSNYNPPENNSLTFDINQHISSGPTQFIIKPFDKTPRYENAHGNSLLPTPNLFDFKAFRERGRTSETAPFHSSENAPFTNVELPNIFSPKGYGVEFGLDGGTNLRDRYKDGSIHIFDDDFKEPIGGSVSRYARLKQGNHKLTNPFLSQFSSPNKKNADNISTKPKGFVGTQTSLFLPKEISRITNEGESLFYSFSDFRLYDESKGRSQYDDGGGKFNTNIITLKKEYGENESIKDLFKYTKSGKNTFSNVPTGFGDNNVPTFGDFRKAANSGPFSGNDNHPLILREVGNEWGRDANNGLVQTLDQVAGGFVRGAPGITGLVDRSLQDKVRIMRFMFTTNLGLGFITKQFALQALNPTLESKIWNPASALSLTGVGQIVSGFVSSVTGGNRPSTADLLEAARSAAISAAFPIGHPERHLGGIKYEDVNPINRLEENEGLGKKIKSIPVVGNTIFNKINEEIDKVGGFSRLGAQASLNIAGAEIPLKDRMLMINPNKYLFPISSAPMSIVDGVPKFTIEAGSSDGSAAQIDADKATDGYKVGQTHGGVTFNKDANIGEGTSDKNKISYHTSPYSDLLREKGYETNLKMPVKNETDHKSTHFSSTDDKREIEKAINGSIGNPGKSSLHLTKGPLDENGRGKFEKIFGGLITSDAGKSADLHTGSPLSDAVDRINMIPYGSRNDGGSPAGGREDFIKFNFRDVVNNKFIVFRAILDGISDAISPEFGEERFIGRPDKVYIYQGTERNVSFNFKIYPKTKQELPVLMEKLNYLVGLCYPSHTEGNRMVTPLMQLTIGDMFTDATGLLGGLTVTVEDATTWEIDNGLQFPHFISAQCEFKYIGDNILDSRGKHYGVNWLPDGSDLNERYKPGGKGLNFNRFPDRGPKLIDGENQTFSKDYKPFFEKLGQVDP